MKKIKYLIGFLLLFMVIGFAVVATSLSIRGTTTVANTLDDFKVYFSDVKVNDNQDLSLIREDTRLYFDILLEELGDSYVIEYDVTNGSKYYDADITMSCTQGNEYLSVVNNFNTNDNLISKETRSGVLTLSKIKTILDDNVIKNNVVCELSATPVERTSVGSGTAADTVNLFYIGREIAIGEEKFNIISEQEDTITMLAQYNLGTDYRQTTINNYVDFSNTSGWEYSSANEIDIQDWSTNPKLYVNEYVSYLSEYTGDDSLSGDLITLKILKVLGCNIIDSYSWNSSANCLNTEYDTWLNTGQRWWTKSASTGGETIWIVHIDKSLQTNLYTVKNGVRPVITISKDLAKRLISYKNYDIGDVITIGTEKFNVIEDNAMTVTMLAQYNLGSDYRQSISGDEVEFSEDGGWESAPGPKEVDIQTWSTYPKIYINEYVAYLQSITGSVEISGTLITLSNLKKLGCTIQDDYSYTNNETCESSPHKSWLINGTHWWTRSAVSNQSYSVFKIGSPASLDWAIFTFGGTEDTFAKIRPVITISKDVLVNYN